MTKPGGGGGDSAGRPEVMLIIYLFIFFVAANCNIPVIVKINTRLDGQLNNTYSI